MEAEETRGQRNNVLRVCTCVLCCAGQFDFLTKLGSGAPRNVRSPLFFMHAGLRLRRGNGALDLHSLLLLLLCARYAIVPPRNVPPSLGAMPIERWAVFSRNGEAGWCGRRKHQVVSHRGSLFLLGGFTSGGVLGTAGAGRNANLHDVWKSTEGAVGDLFCAILPVFCAAGLLCSSRKHFFCTATAALHTL